MPLRVVPRRDRKLNRFIKAAPLEVLRRGRMLWELGDPARHVVLVRAGHLRLVDPGPPERAARTLAVVGPWEMAGEEALSGAAIRLSSAVAGERSQIQLLQASAVKGVLRSSLRTFSTFMDELLSDLNVSRSLTAGSGGPPASARLAAVILDLAVRGSRGGEVFGIPIRLTHRTLADLAGAHRSTVTTLLNGWIYDGVLEPAEVGIRVIQPNVLRELADLWSSGRGQRRVR